MSHQAFFDALHAALVRMDEERQAAEKAAAAMRDGFIAWPLPGDEVADREDQE